MTVLKKYQSQLAASGQVIVEHKQKPAESSKGTLWDQKYIIDNLPPWVYTAFSQPKTVSEGKALISIASVKASILKVPVHCSMVGLLLQSGPGTPMNV